LYSGAEICLGGYRWAYFTHVCRRIWVIQGFGLGSTCCWLARSFDTYRAVCASLVFHNCLLLQLYCFTEMIEYLIFLKGQELSMGKIGLQLIIVWYPIDHLFMN